MMMALSRGDEFLAVEILEEMVHKNVTSS